MFIHRYLKSNKPTAYFLHWNGPYKPWKANGWNKHLWVNPVISMGATMRAIDKKEAVEAKAKEGGNGGGGGGD